MKGVSGIAGLVRARLYELVDSAGRVVARFQADLPGGFRSLRFLGEPAAGAIGEIRWVVDDAPSEIAEMSFLASDGPGGLPSSSLTVQVNPGSDYAYSQLSAIALSLEAAYITVDTDEPTSWPGSGPAIILGANTPVTNELDVTPRGWVPLTYAANFQDFGGAFNAGRYQVWAGRVWLSGLVRRTNVASAGTVPIATGLPTPVGQSLLDVVHGPALGVERLDVLTTGILRHDATSGALAINDWISLEGVSYPLD